MTLRDWEHLGEESLARYKVFDVVKARRRSPRTGADIGFFLVRTPDWVNVVALTEADELVLVRQYRHGTTRMSLEIPGGLVDAGEQPVAAAARALAADTGYAGALEPLGSLVTDPSKNTNRAHGFPARDARPAAAQRLDPHERIAVELVPLADVRGSIARGEIDAVDSVAFLLLALDRLR